MLQKCGLETLSNCLKTSALIVKFEMTNYFKLSFIFVVF